jgi:hypothetical protein
MMSEMENIPLKIILIKVCPIFAKLNASTKNSKIWWANVRITTYLMNHEKPKSFILAFISGSYPSRGAIYFKTNGRKKPVNTHAAMCIPGVLTMESTANPMTNEMTCVSHAGVSRGSKRMARIYK